MNGRRTWTTPRDVSGSVDTVAPFREFEGRLTFARRICGSRRPARVGHRDQRDQGSGTNSHAIFPPVQGPRQQCDDSMEAWRSMTGNRSTDSGGLFRSRQCDRTRQLTILPNGSRSWRCGRHRMSGWGHSCHCQPFSVGWYIAPLGGRPVILCFGRVAEASTDKRSLWAFGLESGAPHSRYATRSSRDLPRLIRILRQTVRSDANHRRRAAGQGRQAPMAPASALGQGRGERSPSPYCCRHRRRRYCRGCRVPRPSAR